MRYVYGCLFLVLTSISCQNKQRVESKEKVSTIDSTLQGYRDIERQDGRS